MKLENLMLKYITEIMKEFEGDEKYKGRELCPTRLIERVRDRLVTPEEIELYKRTDGEKRLEIFHKALGKYQKGVK